MNKFLIPVVIAVCGLLLTWAGCTGKTAKAEVPFAKVQRVDSLTTGDTLVEKVTKSDEEWKAQLTEMEYFVTRQKGTERAFTGKYWDHHEDGVYKCTCCGADLFLSANKFDSGCGWPSFFIPASDSIVGEQPDYTYGMKRTEIICKKCGAHLGHVFDDGPDPTGLRYCVNSASLKFEKKK